MKTRTWVMAAVIGLAATAACSRSETPAKTSSDVSATREEAAEDVAETRRDASQAVAEAKKDAAETAAQATFDVAVARIDGEYKVAIEKCEALTGDARQVCKDEAETGLEDAKAQAKATLAGQM